MFVKASEIVLLTLNILSNEDVVFARQRVRQLAKLLNFDLQSQTRIATVVSEIARNAYQYANRGKIEYIINTHAVCPRFVVKITDQGPGIPYLKEILAGQYNPKARNGLGIIGSKKIMDQFSIDSQEGKGTVVIAAMYFTQNNVKITPELLIKISDEIAKHRPTGLSEELHHQNQELLRALDLLNKAHDELEQRVQERTLQLAKANEDLQQEIAERKRIEKWLQQHQQDLARAERTNSMGEMASALAHELNQPLASITTYTQGCIRRLAAANYDKEELLRVMRLVAQQSVHAGEIIHRMKNLVLKGELSLDIADLNKLICETITLMQHEIDKHKVEVVLQLADNLYKPQIDAIQIQQVIINLVRNAIQALEEITQPKIIIQTALLNEQDIEVKVIDNGLGIMLNDPKAILEPYFTTKKNGMGMGLSISRTIIEAHKGKLLAQNNVDRGACLQFILPKVGKHELT